MSSPLFSSIRQVVALITIEVHARDVVDRLVKADCDSPEAFEWLSQLRFYWDRSAHGGNGGCVVKQVLSVFPYGYEYQGNNGRLVITPLTDRCGGQGGAEHDLTLTGLSL